MPTRPCCSTPSSLIYNRLLFLHSFLIKKYKHVAEAAPIWHFNDCAEDNHHVRVGKDDYFISEDGFLMPVKKNQTPPELRYFTPRK